VLEHLAQRAAGDVLQEQVGSPAALAVVQHAHQRGRAHLGGGHDLGLERGPGRGGVVGRRGQGLERQLGAGREPGEGFGQAHQLHLRGRAGPGPNDVEAELGDVHPIDYHRAPLRASPAPHGPRSDRHQGDAPSCR
jgi:hypothetical protein